LQNTVNSESCNGNLNLPRQEREQCTSCETHIIVGRSARVDDVCNWKPHPLALFSVRFLGVPHDSTVGRWSKRETTSAGARRRRNRVPVLNGRPNQLLNLPGSAYTGVVWFVINILWRRIHIQFIYYCLNDTHNNIIPTGSRTMAAILPKSNDARLFSVDGGAGMVVGHMANFYSVT